uniref:Gustatory receptor n=1 Tax=Anopheles dirus TaxID=7168 RepID=A0A182NBW9_9DIPT
MHLFGNIRALLGVLRLLGVLSLHQSAEGTKNTRLFKSDRYAALKFFVLFSAAVLGSGYAMFCNVTDYPQMIAMNNRSIFPVICIAHTITLCAVFCILPWQTFHRRKQLAALMNILHQNETELVDLTGRATNYRIVGILSIVVLCNGIVFHIFFHYYYVYEFSVYEDEFIPLYTVSCFFMYIDLATEYLLGFCDCLLLIAQLQLARQKRLAQDLDRNVAPARLLQLHVTLYNRTVRALGDCFSPYFGPIVVSFWTYASLEAAICILEAVSGNGLFKGRSGLYILANVLWPLTDIKKLIAVFLLSNRTNNVEETALCTRHFDDYRLQNTRAAKQIQKFLLKNLHQKKKFSACGFFDIDNTVIYMVFSSIVTYLVILIQFKQLETDLTQSEGVFNVTSNLTTPGPS